MSRGVLIDYDEEALVRTMMYAEPGDSTGIILAEEQDVTDIVEDAKARYNSFDERTRWADNHNKVAEIPLVIYFELQRKGILDDQRAFARWLDDPDNRAFRTRPGKLSR